MEVCCDRAKLLILCINVFYIVYICYIFIISFVDYSIIPAIGVVGPFLSAQICVLCCCLHESVRLLAFVSV